MIFLKFVQRHLFSKEFGTTQIISWAIIILLVMGVLDCTTKIDYYFVIAWAALFGGLRFKIQCSRALPRFALSCEMKREKIFIPMCTQAGKSIHASARVQRMSEEVHKAANHIF